MEKEERIEWRRKKELNGEGMKYGWRRNEIWMEKE